MPKVIRPGLLLLHGNRLELLRDAVFEWISRYPLAPLEEEIFLVQSIGVAEWLKMALAEHQGICAATRVELPARFVWRSFRDLLGPDAVPAQLPLDRASLTWRLMSLLPGCLALPGFEPLQHYLSSGDLLRRLQLCQRLADLFDEYQVYRSDWLKAWGEGDDRLAGGTSRAMPVPDDQRWQPALWRILRQSLSEQALASIRPELHRRVMAAMAAGVAPQRPLARRVVVFGLSYLPLQTLQALTALAAHTQVLLAVPDPCRHDWAHTAGAVSHPLLAAWGRQAGDFLRQLQAHDDALAAQQQFALPKVELFDDSAGGTLLQQLQAHVRELTALNEQPRGLLDAADKSIVFQVTHSTQREVEVLHDHLLTLLAEPVSGRALEPRDIVVMVPEVANFAPAIRAVFGQHPRGDARHLPFDIADLSDQSDSPIVVALDWLLRLPQQRAHLSDLRDLLEVPAVAARCGLNPQDLARLTHWMTQAGVRWGLSLDQRAELGLQVCGDQNTWLFGLRRMLLGYAQGDVANDHADTSFAGIEPYADIGGLDAELAGSLAALLAQLMAWGAVIADDATPLQWAARARELLSATLQPTDESERLAVASLQASLQQWVEVCEAADFHEPVPLAVFRQGWWSSLREASLGHRFLGGGVTFCTLVPMRSIPFEVVCLLGMNEGEFPRAAHRHDFDLMALPEQSRPGDRSRRDDDRQLMLDAVLCARRVLYVSWTGRHVRDNTELPPSVLVSQLRDHLAAGWGAQAVADRTTVHPLQPFSRRYFDGSGLVTYAREWRLAHVPGSVEVSPRATLGIDEDLAPIRMEQLASFFKNPVKYFFRHRLDVVFVEAPALAQDEETFDLTGLQEYEIARDLVTALEPASDRPSSDRLGLQVQRLQRMGRLPMAELGQLQADRLEQAMAPMFEAWQQVQRQGGERLPAASLRWEASGAVIDDHLPLWRSSTLHEPALWRELVPNKLCEHPGKKQLRGDMLLTAWVRTVVAAACGLPVVGVLVGRDAQLRIAPMPTDEAQPLLATMLATFRAGQLSALPAPCLTALARLAGGDEAAQRIYEGDEDRARGEGREPCLARVYPDYAALVADGRCAQAAQTVFEPFNRWMEHAVQVEVHGAAYEGIDELA